AEAVDVLFLSQGVPDDLPLVRAARRRGVPLTAMMRLFLQRCPAPVIGITGSAGKTTTTALLGDIFTAAKRPLFVGGNIGAGLLTALAEITPDISVVLEISHTQLVRTERSPHLAAVLNVTPNHLDQFRWDDYVDLKRNLVRYQSPANVVVLPTDNETARAFQANTPARPYFFGLEELPGEGATVQDDHVVVVRDRGAEAVVPLSAIRVPGEHNLRNVLAAVAIAAAWGLPASAMADAIAAFRGVPHRLQTVAEVDGIRYIDDSIATAPERTVAALRAIDRPVVLLLGGREKRLPLGALAQVAFERVRCVVSFGEAGPLFSAGLREHWAGRAGAPSIRETQDLPTAVRAARAQAQAGDAVLLSPAGTSFDAYDNFAARGDHFAALVRQLHSPQEADDGPR
ncbi:MAG: UDP-N-acetylmuramoyl-L-alanine--D-glutamate ligase, partial [Dehalococcoidia bacterium]